MKTSRLVRASCLSHPNADILFLLLALAWAATAPRLSAQIKDGDFENPEAKAWKSSPAHPPGDKSPRPRRVEITKGDHVMQIGGNGTNSGWVGDVLFQNFTCNSPKSDDFCTVTFNARFDVPKDSRDPGRPAVYFKLGDAVAVRELKVTSGTQGDYSISLPGCGKEATIAFGFLPEEGSKTIPEATLTLFTVTNSCTPTAVISSGLVTQATNVFLPFDSTGTNSVVIASLDPPGDGMLAVDLTRGATLIANPFSRGNNTLDEVLPQVAPNSMLFKLNPTNNYYDSYLRMPEGWQPPGGTLLPGEAAFLMVHEPQPLILEGEVLPDSPRSRPPAGAYLLGGLGSQPLRLVDAIGFQLEMRDRIFLFDAPSPTMPPQPSLVIDWPPADPTLLPDLQPGHGLMIEVSEEVHLLPPPPPFALHVEREGDLLHFSWPVTDEPLQLLAATSLTQPVWHSLSLPITIADGLVHVYLNPGIFNVPACIAVGKPGCDCKSLTLKSVSFDADGVGYSSVNGGKTKVTLNFGVKGTLTCDKTEKRGGCQGKIHWEVVGESTWGKTVQSDDTSKSGDKIVTAPCDGKPHDVVAKDFTFEATVTAGRPVRGTTKIKITTECPIGTVKDSRTITVVFDSTANGDPKGIDRGASDLDGDGLTGDEEAKKGTKDDEYDTDGDGVNDKDDNFPRDPKKK